MSLYLLHFDPPYQHAGHYLGFTSGPVAVRVAQHTSMTAKGSPLVRAAILAGSTVTVARTWARGTRTEERRLKRHHQLARHCPICRAAGKGHS